MKITKLIIPLLGLSQIVNAKINQESLQQEKEKNVDSPCQVLAVEKEPDYYQQVIKFEPKITQEITFQDGSDEPKTQGRKETLYSPTHNHWDDNFHCYGGGGGGEPKTSFIISDFYFCDNPEPYWDEDKWAPEANARFHNNVLAVDGRARGINSVEVYITYEKGGRSETYVVYSYIINYSNGVKEKISGKDLMTRKLLKN